VSKRKEVKEEPLNLVPIMNLVTILIPVLLVAIKSLELSVIDTTLPAIQPESSTPQEPDPNPPLNLSMGLMRTGIRLIGADKYLFPEGAPPAGEGGERPPTIPCKNQGKCRGIDDYNWDDLRKKLTMIKKEAKKEDRDSSNLILVPDPSMRYEIIVMAMDTSRNNPDIRDDKDKPMDLFPNVVIAGGAKR
jgi:biopolymer transport protein ExbD